MPGRTRPLNECVFLEKIATFQAYTLGGALSMGGGIGRGNFVKGKIFQGMDILCGAYVNAGKDGTVPAG
ncbi:MAG: hypothetical protein L3J76_02690, partial [Candidatus Hydrothermae bacterium]|nr:hypothetical protein [Candidatus Hydrothermae bacterium]